MRVMSGTQLMPVWTRRSWRPRGLISHRWVLGETEGNPDVIKPKASRTSNRKVSASLCLTWCLRCCMCHHGGFARCDAMLHVFILHPRAVTVCLPRDVPHPCLFLSLHALPRPVSLSQPTSFQRTSLPVQPLPKRGPLQRSPPGIPRVQAGAGIRLHPRAPFRRWPRFRLWLQLSTALAPFVGLFPLPPLSLHLSLLACPLLYPLAVNVCMPKRVILIIKMPAFKNCSLMLHYFLSQVHLRQTPSSSYPCGLGHSRLNGASSRSFKPLLHQFILTQF